MSINLRRAVAHWVLLFFGLILIGMQIIKYWNGTLLLSIEELIVSLVAVSLAAAPRLILESIEKFINSKYGKDNAGK